MKNPAAALAASLPFLLLAGCNRPPEERAQAVSPANGQPSARLQQTKAPDCGPDYVLNDPRYPGLLAKKKQALLAHPYPKDAVAMLDRNGACVAAVERAPDVINLQVAFADGKIVTSEWTEGNEEAARNGLLTAPQTVKAYYKLNAARRFACCKEWPHDQRPDWDAALDLNTSLAIRCVKSGGSVSCS